mmetsp:Transcript_37638/g.48490  ORF Transcript_37638/g.48490 Transcript_37638/m.48490 type:complete len:898 (+) Transcript_37638:3-2696(+)
MTWAELIMRRCRRQITQLKQAKVLSAEELQGMWMRLQASKYPLRISALKERLRSNNSTANRLEQGKRMEMQQMQAHFEKQDSQRRVLKAAFEKRQHEIKQIHDEYRVVYYEEEDENFARAQGLFLQIRACLFEAIRRTLEYMKIVEDKLLEREIKEDIPVKEWIALDRQKMIANLNDDINKRKLQSANNFVEIMKEEEGEEKRYFQVQVDLEDIVDDTLRAAYKVLNDCATHINHVFDALQLTMHQISLIDVIDADDDRMRHNEMIRRSSARASARRRSSLTLRRSSIPGLRISQKDSPKSPTDASPSGFATPTTPKSTRELPNRLSIGSIRSISSAESNSIFVITTPRGTMLMEHFPEGYLPSWRSRETSIRKDSLAIELEPIKESFKASVRSTQEAKDPNLLKMTEPEAKSVEHLTVNVRQSAPSDDQSKSLSESPSVGVHQDAESIAERGPLQLDIPATGNSPKSNSKSLPFPVEEGGTSPQPGNNTKGSGRKKVQESKTVEIKSRTRMRRPVFVSRIQAVLDEAYVQKRRIEGVFPDAVVSVETIFYTSRVKLQRRHEDDIHKRSLFFADLAAKTSNYFAVLIEDALETERRQRELVDQQLKSFLSRRQRSEFSLIGSVQRNQSIEKDKLFEFWSLQQSYIRQYEIKALHAADDFKVAMDNVIVEEKQKYLASPETYMELPVELGVFALRGDLAKQRVTRMMGFAKDALERRKEVVANIWKEQLQELEIRRIHREVSTHMKFDVEHVEFLREMEERWKESRGGFLEAKLAELERQKKLEETMNKKAEEFYQLILKQLKEQEHMVHLKLNTSAKGTVLFADRHISEYNELMKEHQQIIDKLYEEEDFEPIKEEKTAGDSTGQKAQLQRTTTPRAQDSEDEDDSSFESGDFKRRK